MKTQAQRNQARKAQRAKRELVQALNDNMGGLVVSFTLLCIGAVLTASKAGFL